MRLLIVIIISSLFYTACRGTNKGSSQKNTGFIDKDTSLYAVIMYDSTKVWHLKDGSRPASLSEEEIKEIEVLLTHSVAEHNKNIKPGYEGFQRIDPLKRYKRQLIPVMNNKGEKVVWVNCFCCDWGLNWRKEIIMVDDGGSCYFNLRINLNLKTSSLIEVNGVG